MKILCIEDGSVDVCELDKALKSPECMDGKFLVYRQGARPPFVLEMDDEKTESYKKLEEEYIITKKIKELEVYKKAFELACKSAINDSETYDSVSHFMRKNNIYTIGVEDNNVYDYFIDQAKKELDGRR